MSQMSDWLRSQHSSTGFKQREEEQPGWIKTAATNILGGLERVTGDALKGIGNQFNAWDEIGRATSLSDEIRNSDSTGLGTIGRAIQGAGNYLEDSANSLTRDTAPSEKYQNMGLFERLTNLDYLTDPRGAWADTTSGVGTSIPFLVASALAPEATIARGITGAAAGMTARNAATKGISALAKGLEKRGLDKTLDTMISYGRVGGPLDAFTNASGMYDELKRQGKSEAEISQIIRDAWREELPYDILNMGITGAVLNGKLFGTAPAASRARQFGRGLAGVPVDAGSEYFQEAMQTRLNNKYTGKPYGTWNNPTPEEAAAGAAGFFGGLLPGVGGATMEAYSYNPMTDPAREEKRNDDIPSPLGFDITTATPEEVAGWLNKQPGFAPVDTPQVQQGQTSSLPQGVEVSGENSIDGFDKRFVSKWESKPGATDLANVQQSVKNAFNAAVAEYGDSVTLTGGAEKGYHAGGAEGHEGGWKIDVDKASVKDPQKFLQAMAKHGFKVGDEGDHFDLSGHAKGGVGGTVVATPDTFISDGGQATQTATGGQREGHANAWAITDVFRKAGYNDEAIAGILGRVQQEHNFDTSDVPEHEEEGMHLGGYGMFQWNGGRTTAFLNWAKQSGKDPQNPTTQAEYALYEAQQKGLTPDKMNSLSAEDAADLWTSDWEVGKPGSERQYAGEWRERLKNGGGSSSISTQDFGKILGNHMIDFAGSEDDNIVNNYQQIMDSLDDGAKSVLANRFANMYNADGSFNNTVENRQALAQDAETAGMIRAMAESAAPQISAPMIRNGRIGKQAVKDFFTPHIAGMNMHFLKDAILKDKLSDVEKVAVLQEAENQLNILRPKKSETEQAKFVNDLQKAIDSRDFGKMYSLMPQATAKAVSAVRQQEPTAQPAAAVVTPEQVQQTPIQEQPPVPVEQPQEVQQEQPTEQIQPVEQYNSDTAQNAPQPVQTTPTPQVLPSVPTEQENAQTAQQVANKAQQIANVQAQDFDTRLAELQAMPLGQLEQLGQQTLNAMQTAGVPVSEALANDLAAGKENAIAHAESKMAEAGVNPTVSNQEQVQSAPKQEGNVKNIVKALKKELNKIVEQYRNGDIDYNNAFSQVTNLCQKATQENPEITTDVVEVYNNTVKKLNEVYQEAATNEANKRQKPDYSNMSLDELKAERQRLIDEEVGRMNRNPGGKGTNNGYTYNDRDEINGRYGESLNPQWYQDAYAELGRAPRKKEYPDIALKNLQKHQEFAELEDAIAQQEKESANNEPSTETEATENAKPNEETVPEEPKMVESLDDVWGDPDEARAKMENLLGLKPIKQEKPKQKENKPAKDKEAANNQSTFQERREANKEEFEKELAEAKKAWNKASSKLSAMPMFNPELYAAAAGLAKVYVKYGVKNFAEFAREAISEVGDSIRAWLRPAWAMAITEPEADYDTDSLVAVADYIGNYMKGDKHKASYDEVAQHFADTYGQEAADKYKTLLRKAHAGVDVWYNDNKEVTDDELNDSPGKSSEQDSTGDNQDTVGQDDVLGESDSRGGRSVRQAGKDSRTRGSGSVHGRSTTGSGKTSDSGVQGSESERVDRRDSTGGKQLAGSRRDSYERAAIDDGRSAESLGTSKNRRDNEGTSGAKPKAITITSDTFKVGDREQIAQSMPDLFPEQVDDVVKADTRLYANNGEGMMFTNGTGTGKTFTGLGCVKRAVQQGKENILIIAPSNKVQFDWIKSGKMWFGLDISKLENTKDAGKGIVITSYENLADNDNLVKRDWDMIVTDESHKLMNSEKGDMTNALRGVRALTYHHKGAVERTKRTYPADYERQAELSRVGRGGGLSKAEEKTLKDYGKTIQEGKKLTAKQQFNMNVLKRVERGDRLTEKETAELAKLREMNAKREAEMEQKFKQVKQEDKPKVLFLSATPFSYVPDVEYAEGYLFHYDKSKDQNGGYNQPNGKDDFFIQHFGYRMRTGKLTKPDADVNTDLMEINFNKWLKQEGVLSGRTLKVDKDYERGYVLVNGGIGKQIDDGMKVATEEGVPATDLKYGLCHDIFRKKLDGRKTRYLLEAIKAKEAVDLINQYVKADKKVVVFHDFKKNEAENPFVLEEKDFKDISDADDRERAKQQYSRFVKDHPELVNLNLKDLQSPIKTFTAAFGKQMRMFHGGGDISEKNREKYVNEFQDDNSPVKIILCQRDAAKEGISLHDITGKHQRVLIDLGLPTKPTDLIQCEGRIYRTGVKSNAIFRYLNTGTLMEKRAFASVISDRAATAENLAMGDEARALRSALVEGFMESIDGDTWTKYLPNTETEGTGGKTRDAKLMDGVSPYEAAKSDYFANQKKTNKNKAQEGIDYFPTPEPIGFKMVEWLGLKPGDRALEPSAGHGAISRYFGIDTRNTIVEPSQELATLAKMRLPGNNARVVVDNFENLEAVNKYEGIPMNPPYGVGGKTAYEHVAKAYKHLAEGGRLIAIVPDGPAANKRFENWFYDEKDPELKKAVLMAEIKLPQVTFKRAGTGVATKIIVIDKYSDEADRAKANAEAKGTIDLTAITDINELFDRMENMTFPERVGADIPRHFTTTVNKASGEVLTQVAMPDNLSLLKDGRLRQLADDFKGRIDTKYGGFKFKYDEHRAKFIRAANRYLAGMETAAAEQQKIIDEVLTPSETTHFETGNFTRTDNGKQIPQAKLKDKLSTETYKQVERIAKRNGGYFNKYGKAFFFEDNVTGRDQFLKEAEAFLSSEASYSAAPGKTMTTDELNKLWNDTVEVVSEDKLTTQEKELRSIAQSMGAQLEFVTCSPRIQGKYDPATGISYINRNAAHNSAPWVAWHEMFHWIKRNNETLFNKLVEHIKTKAPFSKAQLDKYREAIGRPDISDEVVIEEMMADAFPDVRKRVPFFRELAKENVSLYKRLVAFVKRVMDNIVSRFRAASMTGRGLNFQQIAEMHNAFCNMVRDIRGADGKPIFKVSKDGYREIADMDGNTTADIEAAYSVPEISTDEENSLDNSENIRDNRLNTMDAAQRNQSIFSDVKNRFVEKIAELQGRGLSNEAIKKMLVGKSTVLKQECIKPWEVAYNRYIGKVANKRELMKDVIKDDKFIKTMTPKEVDFYFEEFKNRLKGMVADAELTYKECAYRWANGRNVDTLGTWRELEQSIAAHGGTAKFKERPAENQIEKHPNNQGAFSVAPVEAPGSMERIKNATKKLLGMPEKLEANVKDLHTAKVSKRDTLDDTLGLGWFAHSMRYLAKKNDAIKAVYAMAERAMKSQEHLRNEFAEVLEKINKLLTDEKERQDFIDLLGAGDTEGREYGEDELRKEGFSDNVIASYRLVRDNLAKGYVLINEARMQVKVRHKTVKASELSKTVDKDGKRVSPFMMENFITEEDIIDIQQLGNGNVLVTYRGAKVYKGLTDIVSEDMLKSMEKNDNICITGKKKLEDDTYSITFNEKPAPLGHRTGYMPHLYHRFMVYAIAKDYDSEGNVTKTFRVAVGSAQSLTEATKIANEMAKAEGNKDREFVIDTHGFEYNDEYNGVVVGDMDYQQMAKTLSQNTEMSLNEANKFLHDNAGATLKARHRFFGNMMKRKGAQGYEKNFMWALTHYFNAAARYHAMEMYFKPDAISFYERNFGDFNADPSTIASEGKRNTARLIRNYILDFNGTPRWLEEQLNKIIDNTPILGQKLNDTYNGRPSLALSSNVAGAMAVAKLGMLNPASAMLNFMQFVNIGTMLDSYKYAIKGFNKARKPSDLDNIILDRSGIMDEINLASDAGGYTQTREYGGVKKGVSWLKNKLNKSMFLFNKADALMRKAAILGAYYQAVEEKGMKPDNGQSISAKALEYAKEVNSEANFDYSAANTPEMIRMGSVLTQQLFQFQKYPIMQFEFFLSHVLKGTNSQRTKFLLPYFILTGLPGMIPFGEILNSFLGLIVPGDDDFAKEMKAELMRWAGNDKEKQFVVNSITNGPLAAFTGIDISQRAGMQNFFAGRYYGDKPESTPEAIANALGGTAISTVFGVQKQLENGNPVEAIKAISPALGNYIQAGLGLSRTTHHRIGSTYDTAYERALHAAGFRNIDETNTSFINSYLYESKQKEQEAKKFAMDKYLEEPTPENYQELIAHGISDKTLKNYKDSKGKSAKDRAIGEEPKKSKKPKTEAQIKDDELRQWNK